mgnify:CR=1 FL=1
MLFGAQVFLWLMFYSFCGWVYESILCSVKGKRLINRGFLNGPICPIYGFGALLIIFAVGRSENSPVSLFLSSAVLACTLEYFTSWAMENCFMPAGGTTVRCGFSSTVGSAWRDSWFWPAWSSVLLEGIHPWVERKVASLSEPVTWMLTGGLFALSASDAFRDGAPCAAHRRTAAGGAGGDGAVPC